MKLSENGSAVIITTLGEPRRGRAPRTACPEALMLLLSTALLIALAITMFLIIYELLQTLTGFLAPPWAVPLVCTRIVIDFSQTLLLEQIKDSTGTLRKNLEM